jgi:hypothetical protein
LFIIIIIIIIIISEYLYSGLKLQFLHNIYSKIQRKNCYPRLSCKTYVSNNKQLLKTIKY